MNSNPTSFYFVRGHSMICQDCSKIESEKVEFINLAPPGCSATETDKYYKLLYTFSNLNNIEKRSDEGATIISDLKSEALLQTNSHKKTNSFIVPYSYNQKLQFFHTPEFHGEQKSPLGIWNLDDIKDFSEYMFTPPFSDDKIKFWYSQRMGMGGNPEDAQKILDNKGISFEDQKIMFATEGKELDFITIIAGIKTYQEYVGRGHHNIVIINASCRGEIDGHINTPFTTQLRAEEGTTLQDNNMGMNIDLPPERKRKSKRKNKKSKRKNKKSKRKKKKI